MRKICVVTGSRAEYGLLNRLMQMIKSDSQLHLQIVATNMHLSPEFGLTYREIEADGFHIDKKVEMLLSSDTANATTKSVGLATIGFADAYEDLCPDLIVVLGDRFEMLAAVTAALFYKIPVAHLYGGEITEGAYDDAIRHAITKMSHLHFTSTEEYRTRVIQMGENPESVFCVGAIGIDNIRHEQLLSKPELEKSIDFTVTDKTLLVTFHPVTMENNTAKEQILNLLQVLGEYNDYSVIFTQPNADTNGRIITQLIQKFVEQRPSRSKLYASLGKLRYLSVLQYVKAVAGNSSSGLVEVPSFGIPTINIGDRQKGRIQAASVINSSADYLSIKEAFNNALSDAFVQYVKTVTNPYEKKDTAKCIFEVLKNVDLKDIHKKKFYKINIKYIKS
jgi:UDP-N-acetylglucosamine 2-epimerase (non-hydrolysing)/GDP/UDP-N,N'-diacetylbacillosamine 2-epimerase (hydrolysing)